MVLENLQLRSFDADRNAVLLETAGTRREVFVASGVLQNAFITRAWLDRTLIDSAVGNCRLSAEVEQKGARLEAVNIWLSMEKNRSDQTRKHFKHFGLELNKPEKGTSAYNDLVSKESVTAKLAKRFQVSDTSPKPDLRNFCFDNELLAKLSKRHLANAEALSGGGLVSKEFTPDWRMVTGMGEASVYETNITLHHTYGVPYVPASTIKGILRHYLETFDEGKTHIEKIFGQNDENSTSSKPVRGTCIFFDAFPLLSPRIELDVMTPHYPEYYTGDKPPADWQNPTPIHFLTVGRGTPFRFMIGLSEKVDGLGAKLEKWLKEALETRGTGAKTAVGYGYWSVTTD